MAKNFFKKLGEEIFNQEEKILFDKNLIKKFFEKRIFNEISLLPAKKRGLFFQKIVVDFFRYRHFKVIKTKKTRDCGIDGLISTELSPFGVLKLGLQVKFKKIGSRDVDEFVQALRFAEISLGVIVCRDSARIDKYTVSSKFNALLLGKNVQKLNIKRINLNPVFVLKFEDLLKIFSQEIRYEVKAIYKE